MKGNIKLLNGIAHNDYNGKASHNGKCEQFYADWRNLINRTYDLKSYGDRKVCNEWLYLSKYKKWHDKNYVKGYCFNCTLLSKGNEDISPNNCCYVPMEIRRFLSNNTSKANGLPSGISYHHSHKHFIVQITENKKVKYLGNYNNLNDAKKAYDDERAARAKHLAEKYKDCITKRVYDALINFNS